MPEESSSAAEILYFAGPPQRLRSIGPIPRFNLDSVLDVKPHDKLARIIPPDSDPVRARRASSYRAPGLRLRMDRRTPPGEYKATIHSGQLSYLANIKVAPSPRLSASPAEIRFEAAAGEQAEAELMLENRGNVDVVIPEVATIGIYDNDGIETAFASMYRQQTRDVQELVGHFIEKLRDGHGGMLKVRLRGPGALKPGECRLIVLVTSLPSKLKPGHGYHGVWRLDTLHSSVRVLVREPTLGVSK
jgi:hypothetical protein